MRSLKLLVKQRKVMESANFDPSRFMEMMLSFGFKVNDNLIETLTGCVVEKMLAMVAVAT